MSRRQDCLTTLSATPASDSPALYARSPVHAICAPQSPLNWGVTTITDASCLSAIFRSISESLLLAATPPTTRSSLAPVNASARSVTSVVIAKAVSWTE